MNYGLRGDGAVEDVDGDCPPQDGTESLHRRAKVLLPKFRLETAALRPESPLLIFLGKNDLYTRRSAPEVGWVMAAEATSVFPQRGRDDAAHRR